MMTAKLDMFIGWQFLFLVVIFFWVQVVIILFIRQ